MAERDNSFDPTAELSEPRRSRWLWDDYRKQRRIQDTRMQRELEFALDLSHYPADTPDTQDFRRIKPKDETQYRRIRYIASSLGERPLYFEGLPTDRSHKPEDVELARDVIEWEFTNPFKRFEDTLSAARWGALASGMWFIAQDYVPEVGYIVDRLVPPWLLHWSKDYRNFHDPLCPDLIEEAFLPTAWVKSQKNWKTTGLMPDNGMDTIYPKESLPGGAVSLNDPSAQMRYGSSDIPHTTILKRWIKNDLSGKKKFGAGDPEATQLEKGDSYMGCPTCGYQSQRQREVDAEMPDLAVGACPDCHGDLYRITSEQKPPSAAVYPKGQRLIISAPLGGGNFGDDAIYDGPWPYTREGYTLRSFPYGKIYYSEHPTKHCGVSETFLSKSQQMIIDATMRSGYEQMSTAKSYLKLPRVGVEAWNGEPFTAKDENGQIIFQTSDFQAGSIEYIQGPGLNRDTVTFLQAMRGSTKGNEGTSELGLEPGASRDIPVATVKQLVKQGNIPIDDKARLEDRELSIYACVRLDLWRATTHKAVAIRSKGRNGEVTVKEASGFDVVSADIVLTATPSFDGMSQERIAAWSALKQMPPSDRPSFAKANQIPPSILREMTRDEQDAPQAKPPIDPTQVLVALSDIAKAVPGSIAENQIQAAVQQCGLPPPVGKSVKQAGAMQDLQFGAPRNGQPGVTGGPGPAEGATNGAPALSPQGAPMGPATRF